MKDSWRKIAAMTAATAALAGVQPAMIAVADGGSEKGVARIQSDTGTDARTDATVRVLTVAGRKVSLGETDSGWVGRVGVDAKKDLPKTDDLFDVIVDPDGVPDQYSLKYDAKQSAEYATATDTLGVIHREGTMTFVGQRDQDDKPTVLTVAYSYDDGHAANADGHGFTWNEAKQRWETSWRVDWDKGLAPSLTEVSLDDGSSTSPLPVKWKVSNDNGTLTATASMEGTFSDDAGDHAYSITLDALRPALQTRTVTRDGGEPLRLTEMDGVWTGSMPADTKGDAPDSLTVIAGMEGQKDREYTLKADRSGTNATQSRLGVIAYSGSIAYANEYERTRVSMPVSYERGKSAEAVFDGRQIEFRRADDGTWHANLTGSLDRSDKPTVDVMSLNGQDMKIDWDKDVKTTVGEATVIHSLTGHLSGTISVDGIEQRWSVDFTSTRTEGRVSALNVLQRNADGSTTSHPVEGFDPSKTDYTLTLPADSATGSYSLGYASASDTDKVTEGKPIAPSLDGSTRVLKITLNGVTYTVRVAFAKPQSQPSNTAARLKGIYVNYDGTTGKGTLIEGWNPDVLSYTLHVPADAKGVYVLPEAPDGVNVKAADVIQSGWSTTQRWISVAGDQSRVYQVTVVRDHDTPTADEAFQPGKPADSDGMTQTQNRAETNLVSHGWTDAKGAYHTENGDSYRIEEGGSFAYASYAGQTVSVSTEKISPMNYRYTLSVLAPDGATFAQHTYTVTYITETTTTAMLSGILVNNEPVEGFKPQETEYTVTVGNLDHWTVVPQFDKQSGMSVTTSRDKATARITVTSADGLNKRAYTVHAKLDAAKAGGAGADGAQLDNLPSTGSAFRLPVIMGGTLLATGLALLLTAASHMRSNRRRPRHGEPRRASRA
ncbi:hypothetical protein [Bifidobacterium aerophilum]|uniref:Cell surface protein n=1 Tax=Bifidobacterium aerophilum TaxID=1798155 RepID=A0A6N9Z6T9_9BIFI|nr:hypothetical protein [Bifidobacterium aerophilum]NEG89823.1 hypothetical protein [Bifidobacterium aerophilum]